MGKYVRFVGAATIAILSVLVPALTIVAFIKKWEAFTKFILVIGDVIEMAIIMQLFYECSKEDESE